MQNCIEGYLALSHKKNPRIFDCVAGENRSFFSQKPMGFWANAQMFEVTDRKKYNAAAGKLFIIFGIVFILLCLPLLAGQNSPWIFLSVLGALLECIAAMVVYTVVIEERYRKK